MEMSMLSPSEGLRKDIPRHLLPEGAVYVTDNMSLYRGVLSIAPGYVFFNGGQVLDGAGVMLVDQFLTNAGVQKLMAFTTAGVWRYNPGTSLFVRLVRDVGGNFTGGLGDLWEFDVGPNVADPFIWMLATNGLDTVQKWDTLDASQIKKLLGSPNVDTLHISKSIAMFQNCLFHLNRVEDGKRFPRLLRWSDSGLVEKYTGGVSSFLTLFQGTDPGMALAPLGPYLVAWRGLSAHIISLAGSPFFFSQRQVVAGEGLLAQRALINLDVKHFILGTNNVYLFDGTDLEPIGDPIRDELFGSLDPVTQHLSLALFDPLRNEIHLCVPTVSSEGVPDTWWIWNITTGKWSGPVKGRKVTGGGLGSSQRTLAWDDIPTAWDRMLGTWESAALVIGAAQELFGNLDVTVFRIDQLNTTANGTPVTGRVETKATYPGKLMDPPAMDTIVTSLFPIDLEVEVVDWFIGVSDNPLGPFLFQGPYRKGVRGVVKVKPIRGKWFVFAAESDDAFTFSGLIVSVERGWTDEPLRGVGAAA